MANWILLIFILVTILLLFSLTWWIYYYHLSAACYLNPNLVCWTDWTCPVQTGIDDYTCPAQDVYNCKPGVVRDDDYCSNDGVGQLGCICKFSDSGPESTGCNCTWNNGGAWTEGSQACGTKYCGGDDTENCFPA